MPEKIAIAALSEANRVIGFRGKLPWSIPEDSKRFQLLTLNHTVIMGRRTWEFDINQCPLRQRFNIIISSQAKTSEIHLRCQNEALGVLFVRSLQSALDRCTEQEKVFIIGGATIYAQALDLVDVLELTIVEGDYEGDTFFPEYRYLIGTEFELVKVEPRSGYRFETYRRIR